MASRISYGEWLRRDALLWAGQPVAKIRCLLAENPYLPGAPELLRALKVAGVTVALVSAGFTLNTDPIAAEFGLGHVLANELTVADGVLDGGSINHVPEGGKAAFACRLMDQLGIPPAQTLAAGDTRGDLELFDCAGVRDRGQPEIRCAARPRRCRLRAGPDGRRRLAGSARLPAERIRTAANFPFVVRHSSPQFAIWDLPWP